MVEHTGWFDRVATALLIVGTIAVCLPILLALVVVSMPDGQELQAVYFIPGGHFLENMARAWTREDLGRQIVNSLVMAAGITVGKIAICIISAFALVYFQFRYRQIIFWMIFATLMLPIEVRIVPTYEVASNALLPAQQIATFLGFDLNLQWSLLNSYWGLTLPLIASATATFLYRQFFLSVPEELCEAARIDGAGPLTFFFYILLPMSLTTTAALSVILFIYGWNQYLWPLLITTDSSMSTVVVGVAQQIAVDEADPKWNMVMAAAIIATLPPVLVVLLLQRWFVKGLVDAEK
ncbi:MAG: sn-glycerol-3-phosphate ABC transporter permease UgpE [Rhizobiaceae bacterium]|nr:sn-glycerol-3-phosphate ABC transporter permease UgpE [Rhizobiaceae bacterium]